MVEARRRRGGGIWARARALFRGAGNYSEVVGLWPQDFLPWPREDVPRLNEDGSQKAVKCTGNLFDNVVSEVEFLGAGVGCCRGHRINDGN